MRSLKPICVKCHRFYRPKKNGFCFIEGMPSFEHEGFIEPGIENDAQWVDYKLWRGDLWECKGCGHLLIEGVAAQPMSEHYKPEFREFVEATNATFRVNDC